MHGEYDFSNAKWGAALAKTPQLLLLFVVLIVPLGSVS